MIKMKEVEVKDPRQLAKEAREQKANELQKKNLEADVFPEDVFELWLAYRSKVKERRAEERAERKKKKEAARAAEDGAGDPLNAA